MKRRTEVTIETDRLVVFSRTIKQSPASRWCGRCNERVQMMTTDDAALAVGVNSLTIFHWAEAGRLHSVETPQGLLLICPNSLNPQP
jgi:hypothetical protein